jgi:uncharacterized protein YndB with AHSA1/START domain
VAEPRDHVLQIARTFDAPIDRVFAAWTSAEVLRRWLHAGPDWDTPTAEVELRVGGRIRVVMRDPADGAEYGATGEYTVVEPPHRLVFTWVWDHDPDRPQLIELLFSERDGQTSVSMTNSAIPTDGDVRDQRRGWHRCYDNLERVLRTQGPAPVPPVGPE